MLCTVRSVLDLYLSSVSELIYDKTSPTSEQDKELLMKRSTLTFSKEMDNPLQSVLPLSDTK